MSESVDFLERSLFVGELRFGVELLSKFLLFSRLVICLLLDDERHHDDERRLLCFERRFLIYRHSWVVSFCEASSLLHVASFSRALSRLVDRCL